MKTLCTLLVALLLGFSTYGQQRIDLNLRYDVAQSYYEVYARPTFSQTNFLWSTAQVTIVTPASVSNAPFSITSVAAGGWNDSSPAYAPLAATGSDFHGVESSGSPITLTANQEVLLFRFALSGGCIPGIRLFVNGSDPVPNITTMPGDFANVIYSTDLITDYYNTNYTGGSLSCSTVTITGPADGTTVASLNPSISGTATPGSSVTVAGGPGSMGGPCITTANGSGNWSCTSLTFVNGPASVTVADGNSTAVDNFTVVDPAVLPTVTILSPTVNATLTTAPTVSGTATPGATVTVYFPNVNPLLPSVQFCQTTASATGAWSCSGITTLTGPQTITAVASTSHGTGTPVTTDVVLTPGLDVCALTLPTLLPMGSTRVIPNYCATTTWVYYKDLPAAAAAYVAMDPNGNPWNPTTITVDVTATNNHTVTSGGNTAQVAYRMVSVLAPGTYTANGGVKIRIYYNPAEFTHLPNGHRTWFKHPSHTKAGILSDLTATTLTNAVSLTPDASGTELGIGGTQVAYVEFHNVTTFSTFGYMGTSSTASSVSITGPADGTTVASLNPPITGTASPGASITVTGGPGSTGGPCITTANGSGNWSCTSLTFVNGPASVTVTDGTSSTVSNFSVNGCSNPSVGGTASYAGGSLCPVTNIGTITLTGQVGAVVRWETSTNGGSTWTTINFTMTSLTFMNAQNGQQYRAVLQNGASCAEAASAPVTVTTSPSICTDSCDYPPATIQK